MGDTWREPLVETLPIPGLIEASVASLDRQFSVADWPRSIELGSAVSETVGVFGAGGGGAGAGAGGGGGGGGGAFFLHPAENSTRQRPSKTRINSRLRRISFVASCKNFQSK